MRRAPIRPAFVVGVIALAAAAAWAAEPLQVGEVYPINIDSTRQGEDTPTGRSWVIHHPEATYIALHFSRFELAPGDRVWVSDPKGEQRHLVGGRATAEDSTFWAQHVKGDTLVLEHVTTTLASGASRSSFAVDQYAAGFVDLGGGTEAICGTDDKRNAVCYATSHPVEYAKAQAVARLLILGRWLCTGWLVSADSLLLTNEHCITKDREALNTDYEFGAEAPNCGDDNWQLAYRDEIFDGQQLVRDNPSLDYALIRLAGNPALTYGYLEIDDRVPGVGEQIYMPQHPNGFARQFGIEDSAEQGGLCRVGTTTAPACTGATWYDDIGYSCDTYGGSSGSPVLATATHKVVALHHCGYLCENTGVPIRLIYDEIAPYLPPPSGGYCGDGECEAPEDACSCTADCGPVPATETGCSDGADNDCDGFVDCADEDCAGNPACTSACGDPGDPCSQASDCCSLKCVGKPGSRTCK